MGRKSGFRNIKLGKHVHRQIKRRGKPEPGRTVQNAPREWKKPGTSKND